MALTPIVTTDSVSANTVNDKIVDPANNYINQEKERETNENRKKRMGGIL